MSITKLKDYEEIHAVVKQYTDGLNVSGEMASKAFHANASINAEPIQTLYELIDKSGPAKSVAKIDILDTGDKIACVRVVMEGWHGYNFLDFLLLMKTDDGWKIVNKIYTSY